MMNYPASTTTYPSAFSLWPDALAVSDEETATWTQPNQYAQPGVAGEGIPLDILNATLAWERSGMSPAEVPTFETDVVSTFAFEMGNNLHSS